MLCAMKIELANMSRHLVVQLSSPFHCPILELIKNRTAGGLGMRLQYVISVVNPTDEPLYIQLNTYYKQVLFPFAKLALEATILLLPNMAAVFVCMYILYNMMMSHEKTV